MAPSILRKKGNVKKTTKGNVSFTNGTSSNIRGSAKLPDGDNDVDAMDEGGGAFADTGENWREAEQKKISEAKSKRARLRAISSGRMYDDKGGDSSGEVEVDKHFSLVHDKTTCPVEPFNMTSEREDGTGYFDGGTYVFRKHHNEGEEEDAWVDDLKNVKNLKSDNEEQVVDGYIIKPQKKNGRGSSLDETMTKEQVYEQIIPLLVTDAETVMQALGRYGAIIKMEKKRKNDQKIGGKKLTPTTNKDRKSASHISLDRLTELANFCMIHFVDGGSIYERSKEYFIKFSENTNSAKRKQPGYFTNEDGSADDQKHATKLAKVSIDTGSDVNTKIQSGKVEWEYRGNQDNAIHGPYSTQQMVDWISAGYFLGDMSVDVRPVTSDVKTLEAKTTKQDVVDDLLGDLDDDETEDKGLEKGTEWMRSDSVNFSSYLKE